MQLGFLLEDNTLRNIDNMRTTLRKIAKVISDVARKILIQIVLRETIGEEYNVGDADHD